MRTSTGWGTTSFTIPFFRVQNSESHFWSHTIDRLLLLADMYDAVHMQHHKGNSDRQDEKGDTIDWLSIYRHGHHGEAENPWSYVFLSFFRDDVGAIRKELRKRKNGDLFWGDLELGAFAITLFVMFLCLTGALSFFTSCRSGTRPLL